MDESTPQDDPVTVAVQLSPETLATGIRILLTYAGLKVVSDPERASVVFTDEVSPAVSGRLLYVAGAPLPPVQVAHLIQEQGVAGVMLATSPAELWRIAANAVADGGTWLDPHPSVAGEVVHGYRIPNWRGPYDLTPQELRVLRLLPSRSNRQIAQALGISIWTVQTHLRNARQKLGAYDRIDAERKAREAGLTAD